MVQYGHIWSLEFDVLLMIDMLPTAIEQCLYDYADVTEVYQGTVTG